MKTFARSLFGLVTLAAFLSACSGSGTGQLPSGSAGTASSDRSLKDGFGTPTPAPTPSKLVMIAGVDLNATATPNPVFTLTSSTACFANDGLGAPSGDEHGHGHGDGDRHHDSISTMDEDGNDGEGHHGHHGDGGGGTGIVTGRPYTPTVTTRLFFGAFVLTDPCSAPVSGGSGHHEGDEATLRHPFDVVTPPPPPGAGAFIVATDSANPAVLINIDGPGTITGNVYTFPMIRFNGYTFLGGHTYTFGLAAPPTPTPSPSPTPTPHGHGGDDD